MTSINPYITGDPVGNRPAFVGRDNILTNILKVVRDQNNAIVLYGQRRIGKTSVLQVLETKLSEEEACLPVFFDFQDKAQQSVEQLLGELAYKISDGLNQEMPNLGADPSSTFFKWLSKILNNLPSDKSKLVLLFDEFDVLADPESAQAGANFFPELHKLLNINKKYLNVIFVIGRRVDELSNITISLFSKIPAQQISLLKHKDIVKLTRLSETNKSLYWSDGTVAEVWQLTSGHPFLTQCLCYHIWERLCRQASDEPPTVTLKDVQESIPDSLIFSNAILESLWRSLPSAAQVVASALAGAGAKAMSKANLDNLLSQGGVQRVIRELNEAPRLLVDWDIIEEIDGSYRFRVELIRRWIAEYKPFHQALDLALNQANPDADQLYKYAQELYDKRFLDEALKLSRSAFEKNPAHVKANQLLADILLEQKEYHEARDILEKLYKFQQVAAQSRLIQALLSLAQSENSEDEQLKLYERILVIEPKHPEAKRKKQEILKRQQEKKQQRVNTIKGIYDKYSQRMWEFVGVIFALMVSYYLLTDRIPTEPLIVLEVGQLTNEVSEYAIMGVVSDKSYSLDTVKIFPHCEHPVKQATFKYDIYTQAVDLKVNTTTQPPTYWVDKTSLQQTLAEKDNHFSFKFLDKERFTFYFQFEAPETTPAEFECKVFTADNRNVPCEVREKGYLSLFRGLPWFGIGSIFALILIVLIEIVYAFKKQRHKESYQRF